MKKIWVLASFLVLLMTACTQVDHQSLSVVVESIDREFTVQARGEVHASESTTVSLPTATNMPLNILWLMPEFSAVQEGQVIARFDDAELNMNQRQFDSQIADLSWQLENMNRDSELGRFQIRHERVRVDGEAEIAQTYADFDPRYFSRIEIIDAIGDLNYLGVEASFYDWQAETHDLRSAAESQQSMAQLGATERNLRVYQEALDVIELRTPADGTFIYAKTPWGAKIGRGSTVFPGATVGLIPLKGKVKARFYVPKSEAQGISTDQTVRLRLDGLVDREVAGQVSMVAPIASFRNKEDPRKYFMVEANIRDKDVEEIRVGTGLTATIVTAQLEDALVLPTQAVFYEGDHAYVYVLDGGNLSQRKIEVGLRSPTLIEVRSGIDAGERVSLVLPDTHSAA